MLMPAVLFVIHEDVALAGDEHDVHVDEAIATLHGEDILTHFFGGLFPGSIDVIGHSADDSLFAAAHVRNLTQLDGTEVLDAFIGLVTGLFAKGGRARPRCHNQQCFHGRNSGRDDVGDRAAHPPHQG